jgi:mannosyl-3-phosphoglycerate phosphatase
LSIRRGEKWDIMKQIIFTDLDGTLLDSETYSYEKSLAAINRLKENGIPIIFCSAKTRAEQEIYRRELGLFHPFIVENGGAIFIPRAYFPFPFDYHKVVDELLAIELGIPYGKTRELLHKIKKENDFRFRGFGDMSAAEVAEETGLNIEFAKLAKQREYAETVVIASEAKQSHITPEEIARFLEKIREAGLNWAYGGRLYHIMGGDDKGKAVEILSDLYRKMWGEIKTIGLGDSLNDLPMLSLVDIPILVQKRDYSWEDINLPRLRKIQGVGPEGWSRAIVEIFGG